MIQKDMQTFDFQAQLHQMINSRALVEVNFNLNNKLDHVKGYVLGTNDEYILLASVTNDVTLQGVTLFLKKDIESIQTDTNFLKEFRKSMSDDSVYLKATEYTKSLHDVSFLGFITALEGSKTLVTISTDNESYTGRVFAHDDEVLVLDEYYAEDDGRFARTYINPSLITSITAGGAWLSIIERSLEDKNL